MFDFLSSNGGTVLHATVTWFLVVFGWLVVSDQQHHRELGKNARERISELRKLLADIEKKSIAFHTKGFSDPLRKELAKLIARLTSELSHLRASGYVGIGTESDSMEVRQKITGVNSDSSTYVAQDPGSKIVTDVEAAIVSLDRQLMRSAEIAAARPRPLRESVAAVFMRRI